MDDGEIGVLLAKQAITEVIYRFCRAMDRMDRELADSAWHAEGVVSNGETFSGTAAEYCDRVFAIHGSMRSHAHTVANVLIEVDGGRASSECYYTAVGRILDDGAVVDIISRGRYLDRFSRRAGIWALDNRRLVEEVRHEVPVSDAMASIPTDARRDHDDPLYVVAEIRQ